MKKVYCKNCKWSPLFLLSAYCEVERQRVSSKYTGFWEEKEFRNRFSANLSGECPYYQRKWCKFWVK